MAISSDVIRGYNDTMILYLLLADGAGVRLWQPEMRRMPDIIFTGKVMEIQWLR